MRSRSDAFRSMAVAAGMAREDEVASAALQQLRRAQPNNLSRLDRKPIAVEAGTSTASTIWKDSAGPGWTERIAKSAPIRCLGARHLLEPLSVSQRRILRVPRLPAYF